ncbi:15023_t:CDS:2 [Entrophospora sp. SA101]|nr:15023_t:CDS:2 [Entrophospora sp. SA101]
MLWFIFITFWYDKVSIKINKSISYEQAPLLLFKIQKQYNSPISGWYDISNNKAVNIYFLHHQIGKD